MSFWVITLALLKSAAQSWISRKMWCGSTDSSMSISTSIIPTLSLRFTKPGQSTSHSRLTCICIPRRMGHSAWFSRVTRLPVEVIMFLQATNFHKTIAYLVVHTTSKETRLSRLCSRTMITPIWWLSSLARFFLGRNFRSVCKGLHTSNFSWTKQWGTL